MQNVRYKPSRDIPKAARELKTLSPSKIRDWIRDHRTVVDKKSGKRRQVKRTVQSISMWFKDHSDVYDRLNSEIGEEELPKEAITETLFENGVFRKIPCIEKWIMELRARPATEQSITAFVNIIKQICKGILPRTREQVKAKKPIEIIEDWGIKHPKRLTLDDCMKYNSEMIERNLRGRNHRLAMRNFLASKNVEGWKRISGRLESQKGKYAHLYTEKMEEIFDYVKALNKEAYYSSKFAYKCGGARITATLNAEAKFVNKEEKTIWLLEKATLNNPKRKVQKVIPNDFYEELKPRIERGGKLFNISAQEVNNILRTAYKEVIPELVEDIVMPFHFMRHQFAQHMLRATDWNYGLVAKLGHWKVQTLEDYYGAMDTRTAMRTGRKYMNTI